MTAPHGPLDAGDEVHRSGAHRRAVDSTRDAGAGVRSPEAPAVVRGADPRLAHGPSATVQLLALQRSAGNTAVASLLGAPTIQRDAPIDEGAVSGSASGTAGSVASAVTGTAGAGASPAGPSGPSGTAGGPVTSAGGVTTITGPIVRLEAAMTQSPGVIQADTIVANNIVAASYTPGAGNEW
jgi:hypothetical protein